MKTTAGLGWLAATAAIALAGACSLVSGLDDIKLKGQGGAGGGATPCNVDSQCDDHNPCTKDACGPDKTCVFDALDGVPSPTQKAGDCLTVACVKGEPVAKPDDNDIPDDHKDCTIDSCNQGLASHVPKLLNTPCDSMGTGGLCDAMGQCAVDCVSSAECMTSNPCVTTDCDFANGKCVAINLPDGMPTPGVAPVVGDCKVNLCIGGVDTVENDDSDVPFTATDCDTEVCTNGVPSNPPVALHAPCDTFMGNLMGFCDHLSPTPSCQQCTQNADCPGQAQKNDCQHPACLNFVCKIAFTAAGMPAAGTSDPPQVAGDCQRLVCDGNGGTMAIYDSADPADDGNQCTINTCIAPNQTAFVNAPDVTTKCGVGGALSCLAGQCAGCTMDNQCAPASCAGTVLTKSQTCNAGAGQCVGVPTQDCAPYLCSAGTDACTSKCNVDADCSQGAPGNYCTGASGACLAKLPLGAACGAGNHQCQSGNCVDGVCCNTACGGVCSSCAGAKTGGADGTCAAITPGTDPDSECSDMGAFSCGTTGMCGNAACALYANGTTCVAASCAGGTLTKARTCNSGTCTTPMPATQSCAPYLCSGAACTASCAVDTDCAAADYCSANACVAKQAFGSACGSANQCTSGFCVDGVCCFTACNSACSACSAAKKQSGMGNGNCGNAANGAADPRGLCAATSATTCGTDGKCGAGACEDWPSGTSCGAQTCVGVTFTAAKTCSGTGMCAAAVPVTCAGNLACNGAAMACYASCGSGAAADDSKCAPADYCDGLNAGACQAKLASGMACVTSHECASGICTGANLCQ